VEVEIWSDIACPWCYIGKRRFETALSRFDHADDVNVTWRSFELDPEAPASREGEGAARIAEKYGMPVEEARKMQQHVTDVAAADGLEYHLDTARSGNTFDGHRLVHLAAAHGLGDAMKERLLKAYFTEDKLMSDHDTLVELATEVGLDPDEVRSVLAGDRFGAEVREDEVTAQQFGLNGVPSFVVDRQIAVSGAQPPEVLLQLLEEGWERRSPKILATGGGESCDVDGC
jgi:predicted DsbA family dithiol-disulfide isomerase